MPVCVYVRVRACVCRIGAHTVHLSEMKLSQVIVNMRWFWKFKNCSIWSTRCCLTGAHTAHRLRCNIQKLL